MFINIKMEHFNFQNRSWAIAFLLIFHSLNCVSQQGINHAKMYQNQLKTYLEPSFASSDTIALIAFRVTPETDPDSSLRIIEVKGKAYLEAIYLDKNIWIELSSVKSKDVNMLLDIKRKNIVVPISNSFKEKMIQSFQRVIDFENKRVDDNFPYIYDGIKYNFIIYLNNKEIVATVLDIRREQKFYCIIPDDSFENEIVKTNLRIIADIKNKSFEETKYNICN